MVSFFPEREKKKETQLKSRGNIRVKTCIFIFIHGTLHLHPFRLLLSTPRVLPPLYFSLLLFFIIRRKCVSPSYRTDTCTHTLHRCVFSGHLTLSAISDLRGGILWLITLTRGSVCTAACRGSWLEAGTGSN